MDPISSFKAPRTDLSAEPVQVRPTPKSDVSFGEVMGRSAASLASGAQSAITHLPGGPVLAAAVRGANGGSSPQMATLGGSGGGGSVAAEGPGATPGGGSLPGGQAGNTMETALQSSADMNLYYLQLQESMATENRVYSAQSNVLKARHDTVKNAIGNIR